MAMNNLLILVVLLGVTVTAVQSQLLVPIVSGTVYCDQGCTSPYAYAPVKLICSTTLVKEVTADQNGCFSIGFDDVINSVLYTVTYIVQTCTLYVDAPVSKCNGAFGTNGYLQSGISPLLAPVGFVFYRK